MDNVNFDTKYYYPHLNKWHFILIWINVITFILLLTNTILNFYDESKDIHLPYYPFITLLIYVFLILINILGIFYCHSTDNINWKFLGNGPWYKKLIDYRYPIFESNSNVLRLSLSIALIGYIFGILFVYFNNANFYSFFYTAYNFNVFNELYFSYLLC